MPYKPTHWTNGVTPVSADNLNNIEQGIVNLYSEVQAQIVNTVYPVGAVYISTSSTDPSTLFPNTTWERIQDRFLLGAGPNYSAGNVGGAATVTLTVNQMPSHDHQVGYKVLQRGSGSSALRSGPWADGASSTEYTKTQDRGGGQPHNNMPPYLVVNMWKRTA
jgi:hypothetical protein